MKLTGNSLPMLQRSLDYLWMRQGTISNNIANAETPGYKARYVTFEEAFRQQLEMASNADNQEDMHRVLEQSSAQLHESTTTSTRLDGNNVNTEVEMVELTRTTLQYQYAINAINSDIARLSTVIKG